MMAEGTGSNVGLERSQLYASGVLKIGTTSVQSVVKLCWCPLASVKDQGGQVL